MAKAETFKGEIKVASRIIDYLSSGLYNSPGACLKELINNSYDADARNVNVLVKPDAERIIVEDDGIGMNQFEFQAHFDRISESHKRDKNDHTKSGRPKIGRIGIGFIAANELCDVMEVFSTQKGSTELLHVFINFDEMRKPIEERRRKSDDFVKADYNGEILQAEKNAHFTQIFLEKVRGEAKEILVGAANAQSGRNFATLYGLSAKSIQKELCRRSLNTWKDFDDYSQTMLNVALNVPVPYLNNWIPASLHEVVEPFETKTEKLNFTVNYDGTELRKPIVFHHEEAALISLFQFKGKHVSAEGYFYAQHGSVKPIELQGLLVRIRNAAVGEYDSSFWGFSPSEFSLIQNWVSVEIWADDRLEEAMNIDRRTLRETHPAYVELRKAIHEELRNVCSQTRREIYEKQNTYRRAQKARNVAAEIQEFVKQNVSPVSKSAASEINSLWAETEDKPSKEKLLLRKYSVTEFYEIVVSVAKEVLPKEFLIPFLKRLTERLSK